MIDGWEIQAGIAGVASYIGYTVLESGLHEQIPLAGMTESIGAGLAALAIVGVAINSYVYDEM